MNVSLIIRLLLLRLIAVSVAAAQAQQSSVPPPPPHARTAAGNDMNHHHHHHSIYNNYYGTVDNNGGTSSNRRFLQDTTTTTTTSAEQELRRQLLTNYDRRSFPFSEIWATQESANRTGLSVELGLNFHRVLSVDPTSSVVDMIVWVRKRWKDPRLVWNPAEHNGVRTLRFWIADGSGSGGETSEIWSPDLKLWNQQEPFAQTLTDAHATVSSDGTVFWSRPGHVKPVCKFSGLDDFPFDRLHCTMEVGSWAYSGLYIRPVKLDQGFSIGGSETAGEAYQEFSLESVVCEEYVYPPFINAPLEDWPVIFYHVTFKRSWQPYVRGFVTLQLVLNLFAFSCFWLPPHIGERMSLAITAVLAAVASELVVASKLPAASELTWFAKFSLVSLLFTASALFESAAVIYFHYLTDDDWLPNWYRWLQRSSESRDKSGLQNRKVSFAEGRGQESTESPNGQQVWHEDDKSKSDEENNPSSARRAQVDDDDDDEHRRSANSQKGLSEGNPPEASESRLSEASFSEVSQTDPGRSFRWSIKSPGDHFSSFRTRKTIKTILGRDADDFKNAKEMENNARWQAVAKRIDEVSRLVFPVAFAIFMSISFARA